MNFIFSKRRHGWVVSGPNHGPRIDVVMHTTTNSIHTNADTYKQYTYKYSVISVKIQAYTCIYSCHTYKYAHFTLSQILSIFPTYMHIYPHKWQYMHILSGYIHKHFNTLHILTDTYIIHAHTSKHVLRIWQWHSQMMGYGCSRRALGTPGCGTWTIMCSTLAGLNLDLEHFQWPK